MKNRFSKIEINCFIVFVIVILFCLSWYFLYAYFAVPEITLKGEKTITIDLKGKYHEQGAIATLEEKDISKNIKIESNINVNKVGNYEVTYSVTNSKGKKKQEVTRIVKVRDSKKPTLTLKKGSPYKVQYGSTFKEPGYIAHDNYDGNITSKVTEKGNVDTNKLGSYKLYYTVQDSSGNSITKIRIVKVVDETAPKIELIGNEKVIINKNSNYIDQGCTAHDNYDGDLTTKIQKYGKVNTKITGTYQITCSVSDSFGNYASAYRIVQVGTQSEIDNDNHIKVSIKEQKLWYYKNGNLMLTSNVVTGMKNKWDTQKGRYRIKSRVEGTYLIGDDYKTWVNYWMLFDSSRQIGLHDATWRNDFGGTIYQYDGSHGCVNLPYYVAKTIFNTVEIGTLVIIN